MEDFKILKDKKITSINNCIQNMQKDISVLQVVKGDNYIDFFIEFYQRFTKILKMEKLVMAVDNNPLLISKIQAKYQDCFSDILDHIEGAVKDNILDENLYIELAKLSKKQYTDFNNFCNIKN
jgi:hypothetical protein